MFWKDAFLAKRREEWLNSIATFQVCYNDQWINATIIEKSVSGNSIKITTITNDEFGTTKITGVRFLDKDGEIAGQRIENISKRTSQGMMTLWVFPIYEIE